MLKKYDVQNTLFLFLNYLLHTFPTFISIIVTKIDRYLNYIGNVSTLKYLT